MQAVKYLEQVTISNGIVITMCIQALKRITSDVASGGFRGFVSKKIHLLQRHVENQPWLYPEF